MYVWIYLERDTYTHICISDLLCCTLEINTTLLINIFQYKNLKKAFNSKTIYKQQQLPPTHHKPPKSKTFSFSSRSLDTILSPLNYFTDPETPSSWVKLTVCCPQTHRPQASEARKLMISTPNYLTRSQSEACP